MTSWAIEVPALNVTTNDEVKDAWDAAVDQHYAQNPPGPDAQIESSREAVVREAARLLNKGDGTVAFGASGYANDGAVSLSITARTQPKEAPVAEDETPAADAADSDGATPAATQEQAAPAPKKSTRKTTSRRSGAKTTGKAATTDV